ncbi:MAG TPA: ABC transporter permease [Acidimicrobiia bacterium]|nr:ABC transporter permease [Acidimicrobiia bacterium]
MDASSAKKASWGFLWLASMRDLQWRRRRFFLAMLGTALVFALALVGSGLKESFTAEPRDAIDEIGADAWFVRAGAQGPFTTISQLDDSQVESVAALDGVNRASPLVNIQDTIQSPDDTDIYLLGIEPDGVGAPRVDKGRSVEVSGEAVVSSLLGLDAGETFQYRDREFNVVGEIGATSVFAGKPLVYVHIDDARQIVFQGVPLTTAVIVSGVPESAPEGLRLMTNDDVEDDLLRPLKDPIGSIDMFRYLLWVVAAAIIGLVLYLSALERQRDFAVFKATGTSTASLVGALGLQALILSIASAIVGIFFSTLLAPAFPMRVTIPTGVALTTPVIAVIVGLIGSLAGLRRAVSVDPALAFGS